MMQRNWNPCALLEGKQNGAGIMEISTEDPQKIKIELPYDPAIPLLDRYPKELRAES